MKVLFIAERLDLCEAHMIEALSQHCSVELILHPDCRQRTRMQNAGVSLHSLALKSRLDFSSIRAIRRIIRTMDPDIIHTLRNNRPLANTIWALRGHRARLIAYRGTMGNLSRFDPGSRLTYLNRRVDHLVAVSNAVRDYLIGIGIPSEKASTIYKGHDPEWYRHEDQPDLTQFGIPADAFVVGCAANMRPLKGVRYIIESAAKTPDDLNVHYLLIGDVRDPDLAELAKSSPAAERIHMPGHRKDASHLIGACQLNMMASIRREGLPRAIIEGMAQGVPALVTSIGGMPELVENGISGIVIPPEDAQAIADGIIRLAEDPDLQKKMAKAAATRIRSVFSIEQTVSKTLSLYRKLTEH